jgi:hypothetical protein
MLGLLLSFLTSGPLNRILDTIDKRTDAGTQRDLMRADVVKSYANAQVQALNGKGWMFPLLFAIPVGLHFAAVCVYSVFWCKGCAYPVAWSIAALPPPFDSWEGMIVTSYFVGALGKEIVAKIGK